MENLEEAKEALDVAKLELFQGRHNVFLTTVLSSLKFVWDDFSDLPDDVPRTMCIVDGRELRINPDFFLSVPANMRKTFLAHEAWHVCLHHLTRRDGRDPLIWNLAGDYVINAILKDNGFPLDPTVTLEDILANKASGYLYDERFHDMSTDEVYEIIYQAFDNQKGNGEGPPPPAGFGLDIDDSENQDQGVGKSQLEREIDNILTKAFIQAKQSGSEEVGKLPGELLRYLDELTDPKVPWQHLLMNELTSYSKDDYSYRKPDKRFIDEEDSIIMPSLWSEALGEIAMICDASCSVTDEEFQEFVSESIYVKSVMNPKDFTILSFDTEIQSVNKYAQDDEITMSNLELNGGGGTCITPVLEWLNENKPEIAIIFTDGYFYESNVEYDGKLIWLIYDNDGFNYPFGRILKFK